MQTSPQPSDTGRQAVHAAPARFRRPSILGYTIWLLLIAFLVQGAMEVNLNAGRLWRGLIRFGNEIAAALPPDTSRLFNILDAMYLTLQMAGLGVVVGVLLSLPFALLCAFNTSPHWLVRVISRTLVTTFRTIPDLVWALIFVIIVGPGVLAGILAIIMDTIGFCARFFAERIEETRKGPAQALTAGGARRSDVIFAGILPEAYPSFVATSLFGVEKAIRSAIILGLVGAGGIGVELNAAMRQFQYDQAILIILVILVTVIAVEQVSSLIRRRVLT